MIKTTVMGSIHSMAANAIQNLRMKQRLVALLKGKELWESFRGKLRGPYWPCKVKLMEKTSSTPHTFTWNLNSLRCISQRLMDEGLCSLL